jgi:ABC-type Zn uptake system ZnuABC Zn-binding protein ZnuA
MPAAADVVRLRLVGAVVALAIAVAGCGASGPSGGTPAGSGPAPALTVVTSTTVFADMVRNVAGPLATVESLVPPNGDVHTFSPKPSDIQRLASAKVVVMNGLGLDDWLDKLISNVAPRAVVVKLGEHLDGVTYIAGEDPNGPPNPHLWMNPVYGEYYAERIRDALSQADPADAAAFTLQTNGYLEALSLSDGYIRSQINTIPAANRRFVSFHDAFPYYAAAYGLTIVGVAVEAPGQDPSAGDTARLIAAIKAAGVKAIFSEAQFPAKLVEQIGQQTGASVVSNLYDDAIGDPPVTSYEAIIRWDTDAFVNALR